MVIDTSPVKAPFTSQWTFWAPIRMSDRPCIAWDSGASETAGGKKQRLLPSAGEVSDRNSLANSRASDGPWFIFQLAANTSGRTAIPQIKSLQAQGDRRETRMCICVHLRLCFINYASSNA